MYNLLLQMQKSKGWHINYYCKKFLQCTMFCLVSYSLNLPSPPSPPPSSSPLPPPPPCCLIIKNNFIWCLLLEQFAQTTVPLQLRQIRKLSSPFFRGGHALFSCYRYSCFFKRFSARLAIPPLSDFQEWFAGYR